MARILTTRKGWMILSVLLAVYLLAPFSSFARLNGSQSENSLVHLEQKVSASLREEVAYLSITPKPIMRSPSSSKSTRTSLSRVSHKEAAIETL